MSQEDRIIEQLRDALLGLMDAVSDMPSDPSECWPEEWAEASAAYSEAVAHLKRRS